MFLFDRKLGIFKRHRALFIWGIIILFVILVVLIVIFAILPFVMIAGYAGFTISETPEFCGNVCHNMKPYYVSYENSSHKGIKCAECHNEPGLVGFFRGTVVGAINESVLYFSGNYGKEPIVCDLSGKSCLREGCHKISRLNEKELTYNGITFHHNTHIGEFDNIKLKCTSCHATDSLVHMKLNISTCYLCHTNGIVSEREPEKCFVCHSKSIEKIKQYDHSTIIKNSLLYLSQISPQERRGKTGKM